MTNKTLLWIIVIFSVANLADGITAWFVRRGESNPLYLFTHSFLLFFLLKIAIILVTLWLFSRRVWMIGESRYFVTLSILVLGTLAFAVGTAGNIMAMRNPAILDAAGKMSTAEKVQGYGLMAGLLYALPLILNIVTFQLWKKSCWRRIN